jgi:hypothetical protein
VAPDTLNFIINASMIQTGQRLVLLAKDVVVATLLTIGVGIILLIIQAVLKALRPKAGPNASWFPDLGMDAHVDAVAMLMGVTPFSTQPGVILGNDLIIVQMFVIFAVTAMLAVTGVLHNRSRDRLCSRLGLGFFGFALFWDYLMIFWLTP